MLTDTLTLRSGQARATIDAASFGCAHLDHDDWQVLGAGGMRVLFPWVGAQAAQAARLRLAGNDVDIGGGDGQALAATGWRTVETDASRASGDLQVDRSDAYPFAVRVRATWQLDAEGLRITLDVSNTGRAHAPFGIGVRVSLAPVADQVQLLAPAEEVWATDRPQPIDRATDFRRPVQVMESVRARFTRRHFANLQTQLALLARDREVWLNTSADFRDADVAVNRDGSGFIESATCIPDAFARHARGIPSGLRVLAPGESWRGRALLIARSRLHSPSTGDTLG